MLMIRIHPHTQFFLPMPLARLPGPLHLLGLMFGTLLFRCLGQGKFLRFFEVRFVGESMVVRGFLQCEVEVGGFEVFDFAFHEGELLGDGSGTHASTRRRRMSLFFWRTVVGMAFASAA